MVYILPPLKASLSGSALKFKVGLYFPEMYLAPSYFELTLSKKCTYITPELHQTQRVISDRAARSKCKDILFLVE